MYKLPKPYFTPACEELEALTEGIFLTSDTSYDDSILVSPGGEIGDFNWD